MTAILCRDAQRRAIAEADVQSGQEVRHSQVRHPRHRVNPQALPQGTSGAPHSNTILRQISSGWPFLSL